MTVAVLPNVILLSMASSTPSNVYPIPFTHDGVSTKVTGALTSAQFLNDSEVDAVFQFLGANRISQPPFID
jgi:hypothetical protein